MGLEMGGTDSDADRTGGKVNLPNPNHWGPAVLEYHEDKTCLEQQIQGLRLQWKSAQTITRRDQLNEQGRLLNEQLSKLIEEMKPVLDILRELGWEVKG